MGSFKRSPFVTRQSVTLVMVLFSSAALMAGQQTSTQEVLTNDTVVKMVKAGLGESLILDMIRTKPGTYSTTTDDIVKLKREGVSENEIAAMIAKETSPAAPSTEPPAEHQGASAQGPSKSPDAVPVRMTECEGTDDCATWTFLGKQGNGQWPSGAIANLTVERSDSDSAVIRRADSTGSSAGLTALYSGTRRGDRIAGEFTSSWPGHWDKKSGDWHATIERTSQSPPLVVRSCTTPDYRWCWTWTWNNGHYDGVSDNGHTATGTVESFTPESVVVRWTQPQPPGYRSFNTGKISSQGDSILNGEWGDSLGNGGHFIATWGAAIQDLPRGSYVARPQVVVPVVCYPWFFTIVCE